MSASHEREAAIFDAAMELPHKERADYLDQACAGDAVLRRRVASLLQAGESQGVFVDSPASADSGVRTVIVPVFEKPGDSIGRYKLLEQIGEGGCGVVYVAEQSAPVRRRVALKIIKLGMDTRSVVARFEAERQALALMDHPNIAKVFDAGTTETGRPYFVMELVRGMKITDFCDQRKLSNLARLNLFILVCQAIQHAHQKGIIHRDIKPSNILVTVNDGVPVPKVIDFGIAKATAGQQLTDKTIYTAFEQFVGTPAYMSPEQAVLTSLDIDTRSDIYALGVLLYELLTGRTPFDAKELMAAGLDEMRRTIREREPLRPSTCLSTLPGQELSTTAQRRGLDAPKLVSELRGDLDWIVMKAMEKDRARRYETATGLAADIERHLNNEPVVARPPSRLYLLRKTVRRNKLAFAAAAAVTMALVIGSIVSAWQAVRAFRAEHAAKAAERSANSERESSEAVLTFVRDKILAAGRPEGMAGGVGKDVTLRAAIDAAEGEIGKAFTNRPLVEAAIRKTLGESYVHLGEPALAIPQLERALALRREGLGLENAHTVGTMDKLRDAYRSAGKPFDNLPFYEEAFNLSEARLGPDHTNTVSIMASLAEAYAAQEKFDQALPLYEKTLKRRTARLGVDHSDTLRCMGKLAAAYSHAGKHEQALALFQKTLDATRNTRGPDHDDTLAVMNNFAVAYQDAGKFDQAVSIYEDVLQLKKKTKPAHYGTLVTMCNLASAYQDAGKPDKALQLLEETFELQKAKLGREHHETLRVMGQLGRAYSDLRQWDKAIALFEEIVGIRRVRQPGHPDTLACMHGLSIAYRDAGKLDQALPLFEETLRMLKATQGADHSNTLDCMNSFAQAYHNAKKPDQAVQLLEERFRLTKAKYGPDDPKTLKSMDDLADELIDAKRPAEAISISEESLERWKVRRGLGHPDLFESVHNLTRAYRQVKKLDQALALYEGTYEPVKDTLAPVPSARQFCMLVEIAQTYVDVRRTNEALAVLEQAKAVKTNLKSEDPLHLTWVNNLGMVFLNLGKPGDAIPFFEEILRLEKNVPGVRPADTLLCMNNLVAAYQNAGQFDQAVSLGEKAYQLANAQLGAKHSTTRMLGKKVARNNGLLRQSLMDRGDYRQLDTLLPRHAEFTLSLLPSNDPEFAAELAALALDLLQREKFAEAERSALESLAIRESKSPKAWVTFNSRSLLGGSLLGQKRYAEAEPLLLSSCEGMMQREKQIPPPARPRLKDALQRLVQLYEATGRPEDAAPWKQKLVGLETKDEPRRAEIPREAQSQHPGSNATKPPK